MAACWACHRRQLLLLMISVRKLFQRVWLFESFETFLINEDSRVIFCAHQEVEIFYRRHNKQSTFLDAQNQHFLMTPFSNKKRMSPKIARKKSAKRRNWFMLSAVSRWCLRRDNTDLGVKTARFVCVNSRLDLVINFFCEFPFRCWIQKAFVVLAFFAVICLSTRQSSHSQWINHFDCQSRKKENKMCPVAKSDTMSMPLSRFKSEIYRRAIPDIKDKHLCQSVGMLFSLFGDKRPRPTKRSHFPKHICQQKAVRWLLSES